MAVWVPAAIIAASLIQAISRRRDTRNQNRVNREEADRLREAGNRAAAERNRVHREQTVPYQQSIPRIFGGDMSAKIDPARFSEVQFPTEIAPRDQVIPNTLGMQQATPSILGGLAEGGLAALLQSNSQSQIDEILAALKKALEGGSTLSLPNSPSTTRGTSQIPRITSPSRGGPTIF